MHDLRLHHSGFSFHGVALLEKAVRIARGDKPAFSPSGKPEGAGAGSSPFSPELMNNFSEIRTRHFVERRRKAPSGRSIVA